MPLCERWLRRGESTLKAQCGYLPDEELEGLRLWTGDTTELRIVGVGPSSCHSTSSPGLPIARTVTLVVELTGQVSQGAIERLADELIPVLRSLVSVCALICQGCKPSYPRLPGMKPNDLRRHLPFVPRLCEGSFSEDKKDTTARRLCNAGVISLGGSRPTIRHGDQIGAFLVAAIEALLGEKGSEIAGRLSTHVVRLLEPKPGFRTEATSSGISMSIDQRHCHAALASDEKVAEDAANWRSRLVPHAVWFRDDFCHRLEDRPTSQPTFLENLSRANIRKACLAGFQMWLPLDVSGVLDDAGTNGAGFGHRCPWGFRGQPTYFGVWARDTALSREGNIADVWGRLVLAGLR